MPRLLVALALIGALAAGCGGSSVAYTEVESDPAELPLPEGTVALPAGATEDDGNVTTSKTSPTPDPATSTTTTAPTDTSTTPTTPVVPETEPTEPTDTDTGGAAPPTTTEPTEPAEPDSSTGGAVAGDANDQFCADNPGAC